MRAGAEFRRVGLTEDDRTGSAQSRDKEIVLVRHEIGKQRRTESRAYTARQRQILDGDGQSEQRLIKRGAARVHLPCAAQSGVGVKRDNGIDAGVDRVDTCERGTQQFFDAKFAARDGGQQGGGSGVGGEIERRHGDDGPWCSAIRAARVGANSFAHSCPNSTLRRAI